MKFQTGKSSHVDFLYWTFRTFSPLRIRIKLKVTVAFYPWPSLTLVAVVTPLKRRWWPPKISSSFHWWSSRWCPDQTEIAIARVPSQSQSNGQVIQISKCNKALSSKLLLSTTHLLLLGSRCRPLCNVGTESCLIFTFYWLVSPFFCGTVLAVGWMQFERSARSQMGLHCQEHWPQLASKLLWLTTSS